MINYRPVLRLILPLFVVYLAATNAAAQTREHLTPQEIDLVKDAQILDKRIDVFVHALERRLIVLNGTSAVNAKQLKKDAERWGELPSGSRAELVSDLAQILDEAITNIDDVSSRDERNPLIPKALRRLVQAVNTVQSQLTPLKDQMKTEAEIASFELWTQDAQSVLEAAKKLPPETTDKKTKVKQ